MPPFGFYTCPECVWEFAPAFIFKERGSDPTPLLCVPVEKLISALRGESEWWGEWSAATRFNSPKIAGNKIDFFREKFEMECKKLYIGARRERHRVAVHWRWISPPEQTKARGVRHWCADWSAHLPLNYWGMPLLDLISWCREDITAFERQIDLVSPIFRFLNFVS